ncbi:MAG: hypothetical protein ACSHX3_10970 [Litorimonas sp.]
MSVIARKIAFASKPALDRPSATDLAETFLPDINRALCSWLLLEEAEIALTHADWTVPKADAIPGIIMSSRGSRRSRRIAIALTEPLVEMAAQDILQLDSGLDANALAVLRPFVEQNMLSLGARINETRMMVNSGSTDPEWTVNQRDTVLTDFGTLETLSMEIAFLDGDGGDMRIVLMVTSELLAVGQSEDDVVAPPAKAKRLPPRLGPCHVEVQAVADRVRMSVADCSRLQIGQVISLPGLRFDHLELNVEMGDGPVPLTDASLGADKGLKAVRLNRGLDPSFHVVPEGPPMVSNAEVVSA